MAGAHLQQRGSPAGVLHGHWHLKDARDARNRRLAQIAKGSKPPPRGASKVTIRELCSEWLERKRATKEQKTVQQYEWCAKHILAPRYGLGSALVQTITVDDVQRFVDSLVGRGLSPKSVKGIMSALSQIFKLARRKDLIRFNPTEDVDPWFSHRPPDLHEDAGGDSPGRQRSARYHLLD